MDDRYFVTPPSPGAPDDGSGRSGPRRGRRRLASLTVLAAALAAAGAAAATLLVARETGWVDSGETVVVFSRSPGPADGDADVPAAAAGPGSFDAAALYAARAGGVVTIHADFGDGISGSEAQGSGFVVSDQGYVLTNSHVITTAGLEDVLERVEPAGQIYVEFVDGERVPAQIVGWDVFSDVGLLKVAAGTGLLDPVPLGSSASVVVGEPVAAIGSPFGQTSSLSVGVVSATGRSIRSLTSDYNLIDAIQIDAPINRGNSGGPLFDAEGEVIGINSQIRSASGLAEGVGFAVPIDTALRSMEQLIEDGSVSYPWVGISTATLTPSVAGRLGFAVERGAAIQQVYDQTPASAAGLIGGAESRVLDGVPYRLDGDVIVAVGGEAVETSEDLIRELARAYRPGDLVELEIQRGDERMSVEVRVGERPDTAPRGPDG